MLTTNQKITLATGGVILGGMTIYVTAHEVTLRKAKKALLEERKEDTEKLYSSLRNVPFGTELATELRQSFEKASSVEKATDVLNKMYRIYATLDRKS